jgi:hypothetical protein
VKKCGPTATFVYFCAHQRHFVARQFLENKGRSLVTRVPPEKEGDVMIIFALTLAILSLLAIALTGSIVAGTHRRQ